jgi:hypothetical protein
MAVTYLTGGESPTAAKMNELWTAFDNVIAKMMDDHSLFFWYSPIDGKCFNDFIGPAYFFIGSSHPMLDWIFGSVTAYDHSVYTARAAALVVNTDLSPYYDTAYKICRYRYVSSGNLANSLEAHKKSFTPPGGAADDYWIWESTDYYPTDYLQRVMSYAQVELVFEGITSYTIPDNWNKYNFFRINNMGDSDLTVAFGGNHSVSIAARSSQTVRRDSVSSGYLDGGKYFHLFQAGDPIIFQPGYYGYPFPTDGRGKSLNIVNQALIGTFMKALDKGNAVAPKFFVDCEKYWNAASLWCDS